MRKNKTAPDDPLTAAVGMLSRRPYAVAELRRAMTRKFGDSPAVENAIARLRQLGVLNDQKFARQYASFLARHHAFGRRRIERELKARLVDYRAVQPALDETFRETSERELLERALEKKVRVARLPLTPRRFYALCQSLMRLGFRSDDIMKAMRARPELKMVADEVEPFGD